MSILRSNHRRRSHDMTTMHQQRQQERQQRQRQQRRQQQQPFTRTNSNNTHTSHNKSVGTSILNPKLMFSESLTQESSTRTVNDCKSNTKSPEDVTESETATTVSFSVRNVRFQVANNIYHDYDDSCNGDDDDHEEPISLWYTRNDYVNFRQDAAECLQRMTSESSCFSKLMEDLYQHCCTVASSASRGADAIVFVTCLQRIEDNHEEEMEQLIIWSSDPERVGLDRMVCPEAQRLMGIRRDDMLEDVLDLQYVHREKINKDEIMRTKCERTSLPCRLFANLVATAQQASSL